MGAIREKLLELAERVQELLDSGVKDKEIDEYMEQVSTPDEYDIYHSHKDVINFLLLSDDDIKKTKLTSLKGAPTKVKFDMLGMDESLDDEEYIMPRL